MAADTGYFNRRGYERRARGLRNVVGRELDVKWGHWPSTDGETLYLPEPSYGDPWDSERMTKAAFAHEMAHVMFDTDIGAFEEWIDGWAERYERPDPFGLVPRAAEHVIQVVEDHRIEWLYGEMFYGARILFQTALRPALYDGTVEPPSNALHAIRCGMGSANDIDSYHDVVDAYDDDFASFCYEALEDVEDARPEATIAVAERVMQEIIGWYDDRIHEALMSSPVSETYKEWREANEEGDEERGESLREEIARRAHEDRPEFDDVIADRNAMSSLWDMEHLGDETSTDVKEAKREWDEDGASGLFSGELDRKLRDIERTAPEMPDTDEIPSLDVPVVHTHPDGVTLGTVRTDIADRLVAELRTVYGKTRSRNNLSGDELDVESVIRDESLPTEEFEWFTETYHTPGFSAVVLLDTSASMHGERISICRDMGATLVRAFEDLATEGHDVDFTVLGYSGADADDDDPREVHIQEARTVEEVRKLDIDRAYPSTPTWVAVQYADAMLRDEPGERFVVLITDGVPTGAGDDGEALSEGRTLRYTRNAISDLDAPIFTLGINVPLDDATMSQTYGPYENVETADEAGMRLLELARGRLRDHLFTH